MKKLILLIGLLWTTPAWAWNDTGHQVVGQIAWQAMTPAARARAIALLQAVPPDADVARLCTFDRPLLRDQRLCFQKATTWADVVRDNNAPARREKYHRGTWHYINWFWTQQGRRVVERTDLRPEPENAVERLAHLEGVLCSEAPDSNKGVALLWILHLAGDLHQPLHTSGRVTVVETQGDQGGNLFVLAGPRRNLHAYWDGILDIVWPQGNGEGDAAYVHRLATDLMGRYPRTALRQVDITSYETWGREGFALATARVYPAYLQRGQEPPARYRRMTLGIAEERLVLAGYRLADLLNRTLGEDR
jgi:hypothetical protein